MRQSSDENMYVAKPPSPWSPESEESTRAAPRKAPKESLQTMIQSGRALSNKFLQRMAEECADAEGLLKRGPGRPKANAANKVIVLELKIAAIVKIKDAPSHLEREGLSRAQARQLKDLQTARESSQISDGAWDCATGTV